MARKDKRTAAKKAAELVELADAALDEVADDAMGFSTPERDPRMAAMASVAEKFKGWRPAREVLTKVRAVPTIFVQYDRATRVGGHPIERFTTIHGPSSHGKAQPTDEPVLTPLGWRPIGAVEPGDLVIGSDGQPVRVTGVFPQGVKDVYRVEFDDGASTRCCAEHLWLTATENERNRGRYTRGPRPERARSHNGSDGAGSVKTTAEIQSTLDEKHYAPVCAPIHFAADIGVNLPLDPYVVGLLLGDGSFRNASIVFTSDDAELRDAVCREAVRLGDMAHVVEPDTRCAGVRVVGGARGESDGSQMKAHLVSHGMWGYRSENKHVPFEYLHASPEQRLALLRGLMDTDGSAPPDNTRQSQFSSTSESLRDAVLFLARSLGARARWYLKETDCLDAYCVMITSDFNPFQLERKAQQWRKGDRARLRRIVAVERVGQSACVCIKVDATDQLYVTRDFVVTHNTTFVHGLGLSFLQRGHFYGFVDAEYTTPEDWLERLMAECSTHPGFVALRPKTYEETVDAVRNFVTTIAKAREPDGDGKALLSADTTALVAVDSLRKLIPEDVWKKVVKGASGDKGSVDGMGGRAAQIKAAMNAAWLDELTPTLYHTGTAMVAITRESEDTTADANDKKFGNDWKMTGGKAIEFDASLLIRITRAAWVHDGEEARVVGERHKVTIRKTKVAGKDDKNIVCFFHTSNGVLVPEGFDRARDVLELARSYGVVEEAGTWLKWGSNKWQGVSAAVRKLHDTPAALAQLERDVRARFTADDELLTEE